MEGRWEVPWEVQKQTQDPCLFLKEKFSNWSPQWLLCLQVEWFKKQQWSLPHWWPTGLLVNMVIFFPSLLPLSAWDALFEKRFLRTQKRIFGVRKGKRAYCLFVQLGSGNSLFEAFLLEIHPFNTGWESLDSQLVEKKHRLNFRSRSRVVACRWKLNKPFVFYIVLILLHCIFKWKW